MPDNLPHKTEKPWGYELLFALTTQYAGKLIFVLKGTVSVCNTTRKKMRQCWYSRVKHYWKLEMKSEN